MAYICCGIYDYTYYSVSNICSTIVIGGESMIDYAQHPIFGLIIAIFIVVLVVTESILKENVLKNRLTFSFINIAVFIVLFFIYESHILIHENWLLGYVIYMYF